MDEESQVVGAIAIAVLVVVAFYSSFYILPKGWHPCDEYLYAEYPQSAFDFERDGEALTITHSGGDAINTTNARSLTIRFVDSETGTVTKFVWLNETTGTPVKPGDAMTIQQGSLANATFSATDEVSVVWRGTADGVPAVCPTHYDVESMILGQYLFDTTSESAG